ncbi:molybdenum ABC transporter ATP-binding protein [Chthonobacter albigriseus]|uniref:molybdenum ABC transporter ATP-binding protein n=1 Tax=Chthonobacter albigriseus TaxID=1683161 RepID=UPI0015EEB049|nr:molybdenum ABC transporter ATP-binding protein [Chthonobacter albigriseus]
MIEFDCRLARPDFKLDVAFSAGQGVTALFGPSGSGKSTVIRLIAGLERPDDGRIVADDAVLADTAAGIVLPPHRRRIGLVFQDAQLFPHLSVRANLTYGRWFTPRRERAVPFDDVVQVLGIDRLLDRRPATLSGGERQRVAIGRALLASPRLLLMDEPLASLDDARKREILPFIEHLRDAFRIPIVYVSHAVDEVARLAGHVVRLEAGRVAAAGPASEILAPTSLSTASRFEAVSILTATVERYDPAFAVTILDHPAGRIILPGHLGGTAMEPTPTGLGPGSPATSQAGAMTGKPTDRTASSPPGALVRLSIRATNVTLAVGRPSNLSIRTALTGTVVHIATDDGPFALATIALRGGDRLTAYITRLAAAELGLDTGDEVHALIKAVSLDERMVPGLQIPSE